MTGSVELRTGSRPDVKAVTAEQDAVVVEREGNATTVDV